jgi:hypothetical protein
MRVFLPDRFLRLQVLEVLREPGAVETTVVEVRGQMREPRAAEWTPGDAHRTGARPACPVRQRRAVQHGRSDHAFAVSRQQGDGPAGLAVAVKDRRRAGVPPRHLPDETSQRVQHVGQCLSAHGLRKKHHEVDGVPLAQRDADLGIALESADAGSVARPRIQDDHRRLVPVDTRLAAILADLGDAQQRIVGRALEAARIEQRFVLEVE